MGLSDELLKFKIPLDSKLILDGQEISLQKLMESKISHTANNLSLIAGSNSSGMVMNVANKPGLISVVNGQVIFDFE